MRRFDVLGYGNVLSLDGFRATGTVAASSAETEAFLSELGELLDPGSGPRVHVTSADDGVSGMSVSAESQILVHTFPGYERIVFRAFSRRILPVITLSERVRVRFGIGRMESQLRQRTVLIPAEEQMAHGRVLAGERSYARLRVASAPPS